LGSAKTVKIIMLANPIMPIVNTAETNERLPIPYIFQDNIKLLVNKNYGILNMEKCDGFLSLVLESLMD